MIYINRITNRRPKEERKEYPYSIPAIRNLDTFEFKSNVTFIVGENGSGKSTLIEAIAISAGFNPEAEIYAITDDGLRLTSYEDTEQYQLTRQFILNREVFIKELMNE